jgi:hypothetical protein
MTGAGQKSVAVRPGTYRSLIQYAARLQQRTGRKISITEALSTLIDTAMQDDIPAGSENGDSQP